MVTALQRPYETVFLAMDRKHSVHCNSESSLTPPQYICVLCVSKITAPHEIQIRDIGEYAFLLQKLTSLQNNANEGGKGHPKTLAFKEYYLTLQPETNDHEVKILILVPREAVTLVVELQKILGEEKVALIPFNSVFDSHMVLKMIEMTSILVWTSSSHLNINDVKSLPWIQFTLVVEWEASSEHQSPWVEHCLRQKIKTLSLISRLPKTSDSESSSSSASVSAIKEKEDLKMTEENSETFVYVASEAVVSNTELHYVLTSIYNIELIQRRIRDLSLHSSVLSRGWPDLVVDERTCVLLQPLHLLRQDDHAHCLLQHLVLLSLQFITVYVILYVKPQAMEGYVYRGNIVRAMVRVVAMCAQFKNEDFFVCPIYAQNYQQIGSVLRSIGETCRSTNKVWDKKEWTERPWLTPSMSSHEKFLLQFPCINPIAAQIMLTAMPLSKLLTLQFEELEGSLPWIPENVLLMFFNLTRKSVCFPIKLEDSGFRNDDSFRSFDNNQSCIEDGGLVSGHNFQNEEFFVPTISKRNIPFGSHFDPDIKFQGNNYFGFEETEGKSTDMFLNNLITNMSSGKGMTSCPLTGRMNHKPLSGSMNDVHFDGRMKKLAQGGSHDYFNQICTSETQEFPAGLESSNGESQPPFHFMDNFKSNPFISNKLPDQFMPADDKQISSSLFRTDNNADVKEDFYLQSTFPVENIHPFFNSQPSFNYQPSFNSSPPFKSQPSFNYQPFFNSPSPFKSQPSFNSQLSINVPVSNQNVSYHPSASSVQPKKKAKGDYKQIVAPFQQPRKDPRLQQLDIHSYFSPAKRAPFASSEGSKISSLLAPSLSSMNSFGRPGSSKIFVGVATPNPRPGPSALPNSLPPNVPPSPKVTFYQNDRQDDFKVPKRPQKLIFQRVKGRGGQTILARSNF